MDLFKSRTTAVVAGAAVLAFATGSVAVANQDANGPQGEQGPAGAPGLQGLGVSGYEVVATEATVPAGSTNLLVTAACPEGKVSLGGGYKVDHEAAVVAHSMGSGLAQQADGTWTSDGWDVKVSSPARTTATSYVVCADAN